MNIYMPHQKGLGTLGFHLGNFYIDFSLPHREGWGWTWRSLLRVYWHWSPGDRHWLLLPGFLHRRREY